MFKKSHFLIISFLTTSQILYSDHYMAQIIPYQTHSVEAEIGGIVKTMALSKEFSYVDKSILVIQLDTTNDDIEIDSLRDKQDILNDALDLRNQNLQSKKSLRQISKYEQNQEALLTLETKNSLLTTNMELKIKESNREKKRFYLSGGYLGKIYVNEYEYVSPGKKLFEYFDFSKSRIDIFAVPEDIDNITTKRIFIDGVQTSEWKVEKVSKVKDTERVSAYQVRLVKENKNHKNATFGKIVKVEFQK
jgi:hypothetical protein